MRNLFLAAMLLFSGCAVIRLDPIPEKFPPVPHVNLNDTVSVGSTGAIHMNIMGLRKADFMPPGILITAGEKVIYIDPVSVTDPVKADLILVTHVHADHFSRDDIALLVKEETRIVAPPSVAKKMKDYPVTVTALGDTLDFGYLTCEVVPAYNLKKGRLSMPLHTRSDDYSGYILTIGQVRIYHAGDTDLIPEMKDFREITLAILPIGEGNTAMDPEQAAEAVKWMNPEWVSPIHYELGTGKEEQFARMVNKRTRVKLLH